MPEAAVAVEATPTTVNTMSPKRITLLGFSANPPTDHTGHAGMLQHLVNSGDYDEIWLLPVYVHIYTTKRNLERFEYRLEMCKKMATKLSTSKVKVRASDLERVIYLDEYNKHLLSNPLGNPHLEVKVGTIDIIRYVRANFRDSVLVSINLGGDSYNDLCAGKWKQHISVLSEVKINVFARKCFAKPTEPPSFAQGVKVIQLKMLGDTSSTAVRSSQPGVLADWPFHIPYYIEQHKRSVAVFPEVYDYIRDEKIYFYSRNAVMERLKWRALIAMSLFLLCVLFGLAAFGGFL